MSAPQRVSERLLGLAAGLVITVATLLVFSPIVLTLVLSVSNDPAIAFPPQTWGFRRYAALLDSPDWLAAVWLSVRLAGASALCTVLVGVLTLLAIHRTRLPFRAVLEQASLVSLTVPVSAYAVAMYAVFVRYGLLGTFHGIVIANVALTLPFVIIVGGTAMRHITEDLELVAFTLGAPRWRVWVGVTLRMLRPALFAAFVMSFQYAFEEAVFINFLGGPNLRTLPKTIFDSIQFGSDPVITAISSIIIVLSSLAIAIPLAVSRKKRA